MIRVIMDDRWQTHCLYLDAAPTASVEPLLNTEWTLTNGTGAYAMGAVAGCNTRRYHGLLVAAMRPPVGRVVALNQMWEQVVLTGAPGSENQAHQVLDFTTLAFHNDGQRIFAPRGHEMLRRFDRGLWVQWTYKWGAIGFERRLILHWKQQAATIRYRVTGLDEADLVARLRVHPMVTLRDYHALRRRGDSARFDVVDHGGAYLTVGQGEVGITLNSSHGAFSPAAAGGAGSPGVPGGSRFEPHWWERVWYGADADRGQEDREDYFVPAVLETPVEEGVEVAVTVALGDEPVEPVMDAGEREAHLRTILKPLASACGKRVGAGKPRPGEAARSDEPTVDRLASVLAIASDDFIVDRRIRGEDLSTVIAGYPWFSDWGRDTFISLPGLLLCTGRHREARQTLRTFSDAIFDGLVPNRFDDYQDQAAHYNTVDASLWFIHAAIQYLEATDDLDAWREWLAAACLRIVDAYINGTEYGIVMDTDGLITAGNEQTQLTWMDAACGGVVFTPRFGKAVEINALWFNVLAELGRWLPRAIDPKANEHFAHAAETCRKLCDRVKQSFPRVFWNEAAGCLFDTVWTDAAGGVRADASIRPNQVFAVSLPHSPLPAARQKRVLATVAERLLTPVGLRTLPPDDPRYHGRYAGNQFCRDEAYHQGTVWAWLMGPYAEAVLRVGKFSKKAREDARAAVDPLVRLVTTDRAPCSLGQLNEIYEADRSDWIDPRHPTGQHRPVGCIAQAWSIAELIRSLWLIERA